MSRKAKQHTIDTEKITDLLIRQQQIPTLEDWRDALGIPERTFYARMKKRKEAK